MRQMIVATETLAGPEQTLLPGVTEGDQFEARGGIAAAHAEATADADNADANGSACHRISPSDWISCVAGAVLAVQDRVSLAVEPDRVDPP